jgi:hypothetical protein
VLTVVGGTAAIVNTTTITPPAGVVGLADSNNVTNVATPSDPDCGGLFQVTRADGLRRGTLARQRAEAAHNMAPPLRRSSRNPCAPETE